MAVKSKLDNGYTMQDLFDTQDALDQGILGSVQAGTRETTTSINNGIPLSTNKEVTTSEPLMAGSSNLGSILGMTDEIAANKKRKAEQKFATNQGFTTGSQSVLGGSAF